MIHKEENKPMNIGKFDKNNFHTAFEIFVPRKEIR
jgi:hypothetical protein